MMMQPCKKRSSLSQRNFLTSTTDFSPHIQKDKEHVATCVKILKWVTGSRRAMKVEELREAVTINPGQKFLNSRALSNDMVRTIARCRGLVNVDEDDSTVHLVHHSLRRHLMCEAAEISTATSIHLEHRTFWNFTQKSLDIELGEACMTYLGFREFEKRLTPSKVVTSDSFQPLMFGKAAARQIVSTPTAVAMARELLHSSHRSTSTVESYMSLDDIQRRLREASRAPSTTITAGGFLQYASQQWIHHLECIYPEDTQVWSAFERLVLSGETHVLRPWKNNRHARLPDDDLSGYKLLTWAIDNKNRALLRCVFPRTRTRIPVAQTRRSLTPPDSYYFGTDGHAFLEALEMALSLRDERDFASALCYCTSELHGVDLCSRVINIVVAFLVVVYDHGSLTRWALKQGFMDWQNVFDRALLQKLGISLPSYRLAMFPRDRTIVAVDNSVAAWHDWEFPPYKKVVSTVDLASIWGRSELLEMLLVHLNTRGDFDKAKNDWEKHMVLALLSNRLHKFAQLWQVIARREPDLAFRLAPRLAGRALQCGHTEFALEILQGVPSRGDATTPLLAVDGYHNSALIYAVEFRALKVFSKLLEMGLSVLEVNLKGVSAKYYIALSLSLYQEGSDDESALRAMWAMVVEVELARIKRKDPPFRGMFHMLSIDISDDLSDEYLLKAPVEMARRAELRRKKEERKIQNLGVEKK